MKEHKRRLKIGDPSDFKMVEKVFNDYREYLYTIKTQLPKEAYEFAIADWHYDFSDSRCPHDAWLQSFEICEHIATKFENKNVTINISLLGAYHLSLIHI